MRAVVQRVKEASVSVGGHVVGSIGQGLVVLVGIGKEDTTRDIDWMVEKVVNLRIFEVEEGKLDKSVIDTGGSLLLISQFTLYGDCRKGRRPSFSDAMDSSQARNLFDIFVSKVRERITRVETGVFQEMMDVYLINQGPVTLILDSKT